MSETNPVPFAAAKQVAQQYHQTQVAIWAWDGTMSQVATWGGPAFADSLRAAEAGNAIKKLAGWPHTEARALPVSLVEVINEWDEQLALQVTAGTLDKAAALAAVFALREVIRARDAELGEKIVATATEAAIPRK